MDKWKDLSQKYSSNAPSSAKSKSVEEFKEDLFSESTPHVANNSPQNPFIYQASSDNESAFLDAFRESNDITDNMISKLMGEMDKDLR